MPYPGPNDVLSVGAAMAVCTEHLPVCVCMQGGFTGLIKGEGSRSGVSDE